MSVNWRAVVQDCVVLQASVLVYEHLHSIPVKGKAIPLQASTGREGSRRLRLPDFKTVST